MPDAPSSMRRDVISAYVATGSRIASWAVVSAVVFRRFGADAFAALAFVRGTIGILNYMSLGLGPAMVRMLAEAKSNGPVPSSHPATADEGRVLSYQSKDPVAAIYANGLLVAAGATFVGVLLLPFYATWVAGGAFKALAAHNVHGLATYFAIGVLLRLASESQAAMLQTSGRIATDNLLQAAAEVLWMASTLVLATSLVGTGQAYGLTAFMLLLARVTCAGVMNPGKAWRYLNASTLSRLTSFGFLVTLAQLADYLYAPTDYILIRWLLDPQRIADYAPAIQVDAALLVLVTGLGAVLLPKVALADALGERRRVKTYYVRGTLAGAAMLAAAAVMFWALSPWIFKKWLGDSMPATRAILPLVLIHTVVGGSSAIGRSVLLGMGRIRAFTVAVLLAGASNVILSYCFVRFFDLGLKGIIYGTIVVVIARCAIWMPWYVLKTLREQGGETGQAIQDLPTTPAPEL